MSEGSPGTLFLIPNLLGGDAHADVLPDAVRATVARLTYFLAEEEKSARRLIKLLAPDRIIRDINIRALNEHTARTEIESLMEPLLAGNDVGVLSEAGCPAVADPGSIVVARAHLIGVKVKPLVGPCSMLLALMASGLSGQRWRFVGYLPVEKEGRRTALKALEEAARQHRETQICMDTPYRNQRLFDDILTSCRGDLVVCIAQNITCPDESIRVQTVSKWRASNTILAKVPTVFLLGTGA